MTRAQPGPDGTIGKFADFQAHAAAGTLPASSFLEPSWGSTGNSQHPNYDVALGEQLIHDVYETLRGGAGWPQTLLVVTYDEDGGCYDHVPPPSGAVPPDSKLHPQPRRAGGPPALTAARVSNPASVPGPGP